MAKQLALDERFRQGAQFTLTYGPLERELSWIARAMSSFTHTGLPLQQNGGGRFGHLLHAREYVF